MKTLEELGISPWPWSVTHYSGCDWSQVFDRDRGLVTAGSEDGFCGTNEAPLIAAAPELYEALREAVADRCTECHEVNDYESDIGTEWQMCMDCPVRKWRAALAKAAGESEAAE